MKEVLLSSSVLILALLAVRVLFRKTLSRRVQYALWGLVLVRLLIPVSLPAFSGSILNAGQEAQAQVQTALDTRQIYVLPMDRAPITNYPKAEDTQPGQVVPNAQSFGYPVVNRDGETVTTYADQVPLSTVLRWIWIGGAAAMGLWFFLSNFRFSRKLRKARTPYTVSGCKYPVYLCPDLPSPCLAGLFRPAIYLTPAAVACPQTLRHVVAHESTHARHGDPLWSLLRCVCLCVYWFNPLVWAAAIASKTDCELSCDEGALRRLGEAERIPYGQTLLSLIPVRRSPGNPLLSATTMTAGKKQLKDRITRIAENRRTLTVSLFAVLAVAAVLVAVTFTGARQSAQARPLTAKELADFNEEYFNQYTEQTAGDPTSWDYNFHNQFLTSLYDVPEDIDLYELFYLGIPSSENHDLTGHAIPDDAWQEVIDQSYGGYAPDCEAYTLNAETLDGLLARYTGLTAAQTNGVGLEKFTYLSRYDTYFYAHGDTNYSEITFTSGEREGNTVRLFYDASSKGFAVEGDYRFGEGTGCLTLTEQPDGGYFFLSNQLVQTSSQALALPDAEPDARVDLSDTAGYAPREVPVTEADHAAVTAALASNDPDSFIGRCTIQGKTVAGWLDADGAAHFVYGESSAIRENIGTAVFSEFLTCPALPFDGFEYRLESFRQVLGYSGFRVTYYAGADLEPRDASQESPGETITATQAVRYYAFGEHGLTLLATTTGGDQSFDWDGDGIRELLCDPFYGNDVSYPNLFYAQNGRLHGIDLSALTAQAYPQWEGSASFGAYNPAENALGLSGYSPDTPSVTYLRWMIFTGEELLYYKDWHQYPDHVRDDIVVPDEVLAAAMVKVRERYDYWKTSSGSMRFVNGAWQDVNQPAQWDDWRITRLALDERFPLRDGSGRIAEVYGVGYRLHTPTPEQVIQAGGMYIDEDGWMGGDWDEAPYLLFLLSPDGSRVLVKNTLPGDMSPGSDYFDAALRQSLIRAGLLQLTDLTGEELLNQFYCEEFSFLEKLGALSADDKATVCGQLCYYRTSGTEEQQHTYQLAIQTANQTLSQMTKEQQAGYDFLGWYNHPTPTATAVEKQAAKRAADAWMSTTYAQNADCEAFTILSLEVSEEETARMVTNYADGALAQSAGWSHETVTTLVAVQVVYEVTWKKQQSRRAAQYLYLLPTQSGNYQVWDSMGCAIPAEWKILDHDPAQDNAAQAAKEKAMAQYADAPLALTNGTDTPENLVKWVESGELNGTTQPDQYWEGDGCVVYLAHFVGTPHTSQYILVAAFPDGTEAQLPLPMDTLMNIAPPDTASFDGSVFTYTVTFSEGAYAGMWVHFGGTYIYTVDLRAKTQSLSIV